MTVLLIDASGHKRQMEIPRWPAFAHFPVAEFVYSDEPSYPPVYRQKLPNR